MADGVFQGPNFADTIASALQQRYQAQAAQQLMAQKAQQDQAANMLQAQSGILGRMSLTRDGKPASLGDYFGALQPGANLGGLSAEPTPLLAGQQRLQAGKEEGARKSHDELVKLAGTYKFPSQAARDKFFSSGGVDFGGATPVQKATGKGATKDPRLESLKAQEKTAKDEFSAAAAKIKSNTLYHQADHDTLAAAQKKLTTIGQQMKQLGPGGAGAEGQDGGPGPVHDVDSLAADIYGK